MISFGPICASERGPAKTFFAKQSHPASLAGAAGKNIFAKQSHLPSDYVSEIDLSRAVAEADLVASPN
jgi:hypothetical protein